MFVQVSGSERPVGRDLFPHWQRDPAVRMI